MKLNELSKEQLIQMIQSLCDESMINQYLETKKESGQLDELKKELDALFFPVSGLPYISLPKVDEMIEAFEKECPSADSIVDIELFYIDTIIEFTRSYGIMGNDFYEHMLHSFEKAMKHIGKTKENYEEKIQYLIGCMQYMNLEVYAKMKKISEER